MKLWNHIVGLSALVAIFSTGLVSAQEETAGIVRISDQTASEQDASTEADCESSTSAECQNAECRNCKGGNSPFLCKDCYNARGGLGGLFCRRRVVKSHFDPVTGKMAYCDKCGLFGNRCRRCVPMTNAPFGMYKMAYPLDVNYLDARDGSFYAAQGYGVNISVPLAPTVSAAYNYGWGVPSSRMTYISNPIPLPPTYGPAIPTQP